MHLKQTNQEKIHEKKNKFMLKLARNYKIKLKTNCSSQKSCDII